MADDNDVLKSAHDFFVASRDFNGIPGSALAGTFDVPWDAMRDRLGRLVLSRDLDLTFASYSENPHIKRLPDLPPERQVELLNQEDPNWVCVYPSGKSLGAYAEQYADRPYTRRLALAEPQLAAVFFELRVLENYFRDPRYFCRFSDSSGMISVSDEHFKSDQMAERDKVLLQTFGIGYDRGKNRVVVVYLRYLADLSPEHQQTWRAHELTEECSINSDYRGATLFGQRPKFVSVYQAFIREQIEINRLAEMIGKPPLFRETFAEDRRPLEFATMLRPTRRQYREFAQVLDKMLSDNLNRDFFRDNIPLEDRIESKDTIERRQLGTITLLERWLSARYRKADGADGSRELVKPWRDIREIRQEPAHSLKPDDFDLAYPAKQDALLEQALNSLRKLRWALSSHEAAKDYEAPDWLDSDRIVFY
ncbi:MAG: hypothetical protein AB7F99_02205 [Vicinamibacterales bacterium]